MTNKEAMIILRDIQRDIMPQDELKDQRTEDVAFALAIKALGHEVYWEDVKQALNGWLNNTTSPNTALNDIYRAYMGKGDAE